MTDDINTEAFWDAFEFDTDRLHKSADNLIAQCERLLVNFGPAPFISAVIESLKSAAL